jgi:glycosyltransferase involved in cell wall biosynthesis
LAELGYEVLAVDASELLEGTRLERDEVPLLERGSGTVILHFNPDNLSSILTVLGRRRLRGKRIIGYWAWELPRIPDHWLPALEEVDEVWVPTRFVADAVRPFTGKPVRVVPHPVGQAPTGTSDRARFGFDSVFVVLCMFSATSSFERKNPIAAVRAFRQAFEDRSDRLLVLKVANADETPEEMEALLAAVGGAPNIRVEGRHMSDRERLDLIASADVLLSLHRAEGFGLVMAEAMLAGVPVIATGWSGNLDFIDDATGLLVPFRLVEATDRRGVYGTGQRWADPDVAAASGYLQALARDPGAFAAMRQRAKATVRERLGPAGFGRAVAGALLVPSPARAAPGVPAAAARAT